MDIKIILWILRWRWHPFQALCQFYTQSWWFMLLCSTGSTSSFYWGFIAKITATRMVLGRLWWVCCLLQLFCTWCSASWCFPIHNSWKVLWSKAISAIIVNTSSLNELAKFIWLSILVAQFLLSWCCFSKTLCPKYSGCAENAAIDVAVKWFRKSKRCHMLIP